MVDDSASELATAEFPGTVESVREARRFVREALAGEHDDVVGDATLLASELATNAVIHARTPFLVTVQRVGEGLRVGVVDGSSSSARRCRYSAMSGTGRGLGMVEDVADDWGVEVDGDGKRVWFTIKRRDGAGASDERSAGKADPARDTGGEPDLDALLAELGGEGDAPAEEAALRRAA